MATQRNKKHTFDYDLIVIGSGAGGSIAATLVAREGLSVAIVEESAFGGDVANWGDIPTKALLNTAQLYKRAKDGAPLGLRSTTLGYNYPSIRAWKEMVVKRTGIGDDRSFYTKQGIATYHGRAHFLTPHEITVDRRHISAKYFLVATGSDWKIPNIPGLADIECHTPRTILESIKPPKSLLILGSGRHAVEIAQLMSIFGTEVTLADAAVNILPEFDKEVGDQLTDILKKDINLMTNSIITSVTKEGLLKRVHIRRGGVNRQIVVDEILVATEEAPNVDLGLNNALVNFNDAGIKVNSYLRTNVKHIYAVGDVLGRYRDAHATVLESRIVANNIVDKVKMTPDYRATPRIVHTYPQVAHVGISRAEAQAQGVVIRHATTLLGTTSASNVENFDEGFVTLITNPKGIIIGGTIVGPQANENIQEISLAVKHGLSASQVAQTPHAFLSWSEAIANTAQKLTKSDIV